MTFAIGLIVGGIVGTVFGMFWLSSTVLRKESDLQEALIDVLVLLGYVPLCRNVMKAIERAQQALNRAYGGEEPTKIELSE